MSNCRDDLLTEYYLRAAGVAAVWIDPDGDMGAQDTATVTLDACRTAFCCIRGAHFVLAYRLFMWKQEQGQASAEAMAAQLQQIAAAGGVGITEHGIAIARARETVADVDRAFAQLQEQGGLREMNQAFRAARAIDPSIRYQAFMQAKKAGMLEAIVSGRLPVAEPAAASAQEPGDTAGEAA